MATVWAAAGSGTLEDFLEVYKSGDLAACRRDDGRNLLTEAVGNTGDRARISNFLLDEGADATTVVQPEGYNCLHILLARTPDKNVNMPGVIEKNAADAALLRRLLEHGADINAVAKKRGTPLQRASERIVNLPNEELVVPLYEILFSRPDLDLMKPGAFGKSTYESIWEEAALLPIAYEFAQRYLRNHGLPVPDLGAPPEV